MEVEIVQDLESLAAFAPDWNRLALEAPQSLPMLSYAWVASYLGHRLLPEDKWFCLMARENGRLVGVLPLVTRPEKMAGTSGRAVFTPHDWHTFSVDFLIIPGREEEVISLFTLTMERLVPDWLYLRLMRIPDTSPTLAYIRKSARNTAVIKTCDGDGSIVNVRGEFDDYLAGLSSNFRRNLKKAVNRLGKLPRVEVVTVRGTEATEKHLQDFLNLEESGWKGRAGSAIKSSADLRPFYETLVRRLSEAGWLEWAFLTTDGRPIAGKMNIRFGSTLVMGKIAYDEAFAGYSPSNLLILEVIKGAYAAKDIIRVDLLTDMPWHRNWNATYINYYNLWLFPRRPLSLLLGYLPRRMRTMIQQRPFIGPVIRAVRDRFRPTAGDRLESV